MASDEENSADAKSVEDSQIHIELWVDKVRSSFAEESEESIRAYAIENAGKLPDPSRLFGWPHTRFLRKFDVQWIESFVEPDKARRFGIPEVTSTLALIAILILVARPSFGFLQIVIVVLLILYLLMQAYPRFVDARLRRYVLEKRGPLGCALMHPLMEQSIMIMGMAVCYASIYGYVVFVVSMPTSYQKYFAIATPAIVFFFFIGIFTYTACYFYYRALISNNFEIVNKILETRRANIENDRARKNLSA